MLISLHALPVLIIYTNLMLETWFWSILLSSHLVFSSICIQIMIYARISPFLNYFNMIVFNAHHNRPLNYEEKVHGTHTYGVAAVKILESDISFILGILALRSCSPNYPFASKNTLRTLSIPKKDNCSVCDKIKFELSRVRYIW